jgi:hypothetical protein
MKHYAMKTYDSGYIHPSFLHLETSWSWVVSFTHRPLYPRGKTPDTHCIGEWVDSRVGLDMEKWKLLPPRDSNSDSSVVQSVASRYTDCAVPAIQFKILSWLIFWFNIFRLSYLFNSLKKCCILSHSACELGDFSRSDTEGLRNRNPLGEEYFQLPEFSLPFAP